MSAYIETPDGDRLEIGQYVQLLEDNVMQLKELLRRAYGLVAQASHKVDATHPNWHRNAEAFLRDCVDLEGT